MNNFNNYNNTVTIVISTPRRCFLGLSRVLGYVIHVNGIRKNKQEKNADIKTRPKMRVKRCKH